MAVRMAFCVHGNKVDSVPVNFEWVPGFAKSQVRKNVANMHRVLNASTLEVSTVGEEEIGKSLSAFTLKYKSNVLECVFQASKVFTDGGPYKDLLKVSPRQAKKDERIHNSGSLIAFELEGQKWPLSPKSAFYDYLYVQAVKQSIPMNKLQEIMGYQFFTDIYFQHQKMYNTQARSIALVQLIIREFGNIPDFTSREFIKYHKKHVKN